MEEKYEDALFGSTYTLDAPKYDEATHSITVVFAASKGKDRIGDFLEVSGIDTTKHRANPVAYLDHGKNGCTMPIGKCVDPQGNYTVTIDEEAGTATAVVYLATDVPDFHVPEQCFELYKQGILRAGSIGYRPLEAKRIKAAPDEGHFKDSLWLKEVELIEVSLVGVPMNADCVVKSINGKELDSCFSKIWDERVHKNMSDVQPAMSATDQSTGGALVGQGDDDLHKRLAALEESHKALSERFKMYEQKDVPAEPATKSYQKKDNSPPSEDMKALLDEVKDHLDEAAEHDETPDDLREAHKHFSKAIEESDEPDADTHEVLVKALQTHLEESAAHPECGKCMAAAHKYYAGKCADCAKDEPEENMSPEQEAAVTKAIDSVLKKFAAVERKLNKSQKGVYVN